MYIENTNFTKNYLEQALSLFEVTKQRPINPNEKDKLVKVLKKRLELEQEEITLYNSHTDETSVGTMKSLIELCYKPNTIISSYGALFDASKDHLNYPGKMLDDMKADRKIVKTEAFTHINDEDKKTYNRLMSAQETIKLYMNSYFGATGAKPFILFNDLIPACITYTGVATTTTVLLAMEGMLGANVGFININDFYNFVTNCCNDFKKTKFPIKDILDEVKPKDVIISLLSEKFLKMCEFSCEIKEIQDFLNLLSEEQLNRLFYKRNLYSFLKNEKITSLLGDCYDSEFINPEHPPDNITEACSLLSDLVKEFVGYFHMHVDRYERVSRMHRNAVLVTDTDSIFVYLGNLVVLYRSLFDLSEEDNRLGETLVDTCIANIVIRMIWGLIEDTLAIFTANMNVLPKRRKDIMMKSEMLLSRLVTTDNKKSYAALMVAKEGRYLTKPKLDLKGIQIKKANVAKTTKIFFSNLLEKDILQTKQFSVVAIINKIEQYKRTIAEQIKVHGSLEYASSKRYNTFSAYAFPYRMDVLRGVILWNILHPENTIQDYQEVNFMKLSAYTLEELNKKIDPTYEKERSLIEESYFSNEDLVHYGITGISIPKDIEVLPPYLSTLVDIETIVSDNIASFLPIIHSLGLAVIPDGNKKQMSNYIRL